MNELPQGWNVAKLPDVCELNPGKQSANHLEATMPVTFVPMAAVDAASGTIKTPTTRPYSEVAKGFTAFQDNDVLMAKITPCMENGKAAIARNLCNGFGFGSTEFHVFRPSAAITSEYIFYFIRQEPFRKLAEAHMTGSVGQKRVPASFLKEVEIPIPPLNEQRRIVAKLEKLLSKVEACQQRLEKIPLILKRFRQSVLAAACSGKLTADWRAEHPNVESAATLLRTIGLGSKPVSPFDIGLDEIPESWSIINFGPLTVSIRGGSTAVPQNEPTNFPILRSSSVRPGYVNLEDVKYLSEKDSQNELNYLCEGDLLFTRLSGSLEYVANCALVRNLNGKRIQYPDRLFCAKLVPLMNASYSELVFAAPFIRAQITEHAKSSAGHQRVSISDIAGQLIPIAPSVEQQDIVRRVEALFKIADQIEARYRKAKAYVDKLTHSILAKAFRGELVPQDPNDEPASVLLERIRKEREQTPNMKSKARRASRSEKQAGLFNNTASHG